MRTRQSGPLDAPAAKEPKTNIGRIASLQPTDEAHVAERGPSPMGYKVGATSNSPMYFCRNDLCDEQCATQGLETAHAVSCLKRRPVQSVNSDPETQNSLTFPIKQRKKLMPSLIQKQESRLMTLFLSKMLSLMLKGTTNHLLLRMAPSESKHLALKHSCLK